MKEDFVTYEIAKKLKEKGFREKCLYHYNNNDILKENYSKCYCSANSIFTDNTVDAPTIYQVLHLLREEKKIHMIIDISEEGWFFNLRFLKTGYIIDCTMFGFSDTYEQAVLAGIEYVLNNLI